MKIDLTQFKAEIVTLGGAIATAIGMIADQKLLAIIASVPGITAMYGQYVKGHTSAEEVANLVVQQLEAEKAGGK